MGSTPIIVSHRQAELHDIEKIDQLIAFCAVPSDSRPWWINIASAQDFLEALVRTANKKDRSPAGSSSRVYALAEFCNLVDGANIESAQSVVVMTEDPEWMAIFGSKCQSADLPGLLKSLEEEKHRLAYSAPHIPDFDQYRRADKIGSGYAEVLSAMEHRWQTHDISDGIAWCLSLVSDFYQTFRPEGRAVNEPVDMFENARWIERYRQTTLDGLSKIFHIADPQVVDTALSMLKQIPVTGLESMAHFVGSVIGRAVDLGIPVQDHDAPIALSELVRWIFSQAIHSDEIAGCIMRTSYHDYDINSAAFLEEMCVLLPEFRRRPLNGSSMSNASILSDVCEAHPYIDAKRIQSALLRSNQSHGVDFACKMNAGQATPLEVKRDLVINALDAVADLGRQCNEFTLPNLVSLAGLLDTGSDSIEFLAIASKIESLYEWPDMLQCGHWIGALGSKTRLIVDLLMERWTDEDKPLWVEIVKSKLTQHSSQGGVGIPPTISGYLQSITTGGISDGRVR